VTSSHLAAFGDALLWTLEHQFGSSFTPELRQAWAALYEAVQSDMLPPSESKLE
jgi:hemoglobin-like flavoprotein